MYVTIRALSELAPERREQEYKAIANKALRVYRADSTVPDIREAIRRVMADMKLSDALSDIEVVETLIARVG
jgi:hypothetical protein